MACGEKRNNNNNNNNNNSLGIINVQA
jgi:hypothetical protein